MFHAEKLAVASERYSCYLYRIQATDRVSQGFSLLSCGVPGLTETGVKPEINKYFKHATITILALPGIKSSSDLIIIFFIECVYLSPNFVV